MANINFNVSKLKTVFNLKLRQLLLFYTYRSKTQLYFDRTDGKSNGFIPESSWFARHNAILSVPNVYNGAKVINKHATVECHNFHYKTWDNFTDIPNMDFRIAEVLSKMGRVRMTPIQGNTFDILNRQLFDLMGCAETGSGKTLAYLAPIINSMLSKYPKLLMENLIHSEIQTPMLLVLAPTRELVQQICSEAKCLTQLTPLCIADVVGGVPYATQVSGIRSGCHSIIATPGRLLRLLRDKVISLKHCRSIVLDEADVMFNVGFTPHIREIMSEFDLPDCDNRQTVLFSATFSNDALTAAKGFLHNNFAKITIGNKAGSTEPLAPESIIQTFVLCRPDQITTELFKLLSDTSKKTIVFCNETKEIECFGRIALKLKMNVVLLYGNLDSGERQRNLRAFRRDEVKILIISSDLARGLDVVDTDRVVNFGAPSSGNIYLHRIGRCGRLGRPGEAITLVTKEQLRKGSFVHDVSLILKNAGQMVPTFMEDIKTKEYKFVPKK